MASIATLSWRTRCSWIRPKTTIASSRARPPKRSDSNRSPSIGSDPIVIRSGPHGRSSRRPAFGSDPSPIGKTPRQDADDPRSLAPTDGRKPCPTRRTPRASIPAVPAPSPPFVLSAKRSKDVHHQSQKFRPDRCARKYGVTIVQRRACALRRWPSGRPLSEPRSRNVVESPLAIGFATNFPPRWCRPRAAWDLARNFMPQPGWG